MYALGMTVGVVLFAIGAYIGISSAGLIAPVAVLTLSVVVSAMTIIDAAASL